MSKTYPLVARKTLEYFFKQGEKPTTLADLEAVGIKFEDVSLNAPSQGVFVSLHLTNAAKNLRGCIGTITGVQETLGQEIIQNALSAAFRDPRFQPLQAVELSQLHISVDVLSAPAPCTRADLDPKQYGVIVTSGWKRGLLLPDLEGVDDIDTQLSIALRKGGVSPNERYQIERFTVDRYEE
jgi:AmmeMemoRadiSam system protein A